MAEQGLIGAARRRRSGVEGAAGAPGDDVCSGSGRGEAAGKLGLTCPPKGLAMTVGRQPLVVRLTPAQALRMERMGECLWPTEKLSAAEVTWRLALTQLLWAESERGMVESVRTSA